MKIPVVGIVTVCLIHFAAAQSPSPTPSGPQANTPSSTSGPDCGQPDPQAVHQHVSYNDNAPDCDFPTVTVQTLTNPFSEASLVMITFTVDDDILINGEVYQSPGSDFSYQDTSPDPCPDANGAHSDIYLGVLGPGESITLGVTNNFRGYISLDADVYFNPPGSSPSTCAAQVDQNQTKDDDEHTQRNPCPMAQYFFHFMLASLHIEDTPISYKPPRGPSVNFRVAYNQREANQPEFFDYSNFGSKWTFNWLSYVTDNPVDPSANASVYVRGGGTELYTGFDSDTQSYAPDPQSQAVLVRTDGGLYYEKRFRDGSKEVFRASDAMSSYPRRVFLTSIVDPSGNVVTLGYDSGFRLATITDPLGQITTLSYENNNDSLKITKVTDPFGRVVRFDYTAGELSQITDPVGIKSQFHYTDGTDFIESMTTPYGTTRFTTGQNGDVQRWVEATDPLGGKERVEYDGFTKLAATDSVAPTGVENAGLNRQTTFFWDKKAMADAPKNYKKARMIKWLVSPDGTTVSGIKHSEKLALESRVWYTYPNQPDGNTVGTSAYPLRVARILDDRSEQDWQYSYNSLGNMTKKIDPVGRTTSYAYDDNEVDLLTIFQRNPSGSGTDPDGASADIVGNYTYNSQHKPLTAADAAGQTTHYTYNSYGQVQTVEDSKQETTTYTYGDGTTVPTGYLASITGPSFNGSSATTSYTYDSAHRVRTATNSPDGYAVTTDYDNLDRPTQISYPNGSTQQFQYAQDFGNGVTTILELTASKDRDDRWTTRTYDANRHLTALIDPLGQTTSYGWCNCGALTSITDANHNLTTFSRDIQSRLEFKQFADGTTIFYGYENSTSRLTEVFNERNGQEIDYTYLLDDNIGQINYFNDFNDPTLAATPGVSFVYDPNYNRVTSMTDGIGTTSYSYYPSGVLGGGKPHQTSGPLPNSTITYSYDELGRVTSQDINGTPSTMAYDSLGRLGTTSNALGSFSRNYDSVTQRLLVMSYPNGQSANYNYFDNSVDRRLQSIQNLDSGSNLLSEFDYTYDPEGQIQSLIGPFQGWQLSYDDGKRLIGVTLGPGNGSGGLTAIGGGPTWWRPSTNYAYDAAGNRLGSLSNSPFAAIGTGYTANNLNQLSSVFPVANFDFLTGNNPPSGTPLTYDGNGNMTYDGNNQTFEWDLANRLAAINYLDSGGRTEFAYDGLGRRVRITEYNGVAAATVQPMGDNASPADYATFSTEPFTVAEGNYTLTFQGLDNSGNYIALIDAAKLNDALVPNGSFESPVLADGDYEPGGGGDTVWNYNSMGYPGAGISAGDGAPAAGNPIPPDGSQVGFIQGLSAISQTFLIPAGTYTLSFAAAQSLNWNTGSFGADQNGSFIGVQKLRMTLRGAAASSVKTFVWCGNAICEERDATGANVTKRYFAEGEQRIGGADAGNYYYTRDHLGSIREVMDSNGSLVAQFDYDPWGNQAVINGNMSIDFGFTGHYVHQASGLYLTLNRVYNPTLARWISRDPLENAEMSQGANLYWYAANDPINKTDLLGMCIGDWWDPRTWFNEGLTDSLWDTALSISDSLGGLAATPFYGDPAWQQVLDAGAYNPLGQTENNPAAYAAEWGLLGTSALATGTAAAAGLYEEGLRIDGPSAGFLGYGEGRILQLRWGDTPLLRLDYAPIPGSDGEPVLHLNVGTTDVHIPLYDSRYPTFPPGS